MWENPNRSQNSIHQDNNKHIEEKYLKDIRLSCGLMCVYGSISTERIRVLNGEISCNLFNKAIHFISCPTFDVISMCSRKWAQTAISSVKLFDSWRYFINQNGANKLNKSLSTSVQTDDFEERPVSCTKVLKNSFPLEYEPKPTLMIYE